MKTRYKLFVLLISFGLLFSCQEEEPINVNQPEADRQNLLIDQINQGISVSGNKGPKVTEEFSATVDGAIESYSIISFASSGSSASFGGSNITPPSGISFALFGLDTGRYDLTDVTSGATYSGGPGIAYESILGELIIDSLTNSFLIGRFEFDAALIPSGSDTVRVTDGSFKVNR